jgi:hypothetical protein
MNDWRFSLTISLLVLIVVTIPEGNLSGETLIYTNPQMV